MIDLFDLFDLLIGWSIHIPYIDWSIWFIDLFIDWCFIDWCIYWFIYWLIELQLYLLIGLFIDWRIYWLNCWMIYWLICWLTYWLIYWLGYILIYSLCQSTTSGSLNERELRFALRAFGIDLDATEVQTIVAGRERVDDEFFKELI